MPLSRQSRFLLEKTFPVQLKDGNGENSDQFETESCSLSPELLAISNVVSSFPESGDGIDKVLVNQVLEGQLIEGTKPLPAFVMLVDARGDGRLAVAFAFKFIDHEHNSGSLLSN